jgi:hypothetical protein
LLRPPNGYGGLVRTSHRNAAAVIAVATAMASVFVVSYSLALGRPKPHRVPAALVGRGPRVVAAFERSTEDGLRFERFASLRAAERAIGDQHVYAALDVAASPPKLLVASAAGVSVARLLEQVANGVSVATRSPILVRDVRPLPASDPSGLVSFYVTLGATILGFVTMFQLRAHTEGLSLRAWLASIAALAVAGGLVLSVVADPLLHALRGPFLELWAALAAQVAVAALFNAVMLTLVGRFAIIPTWAFFVAVGNASSGGAVAPPLLPEPYALIGRFLPSGATVEIIRNAVYFVHAQHLEPIVVEGCWLAATLAALLLIAHRRGVTPGST